MPPTAPPAPTEVRDLRGGASEALALAETKKKNKVMVHDGSSEAVGIDGQLRGCLPLMELPPYGESDVDWKVLVRRSDQFTWQFWRVLEKDF